MPTQLKVVLPDTGIDDNLSTTSDAENHDEKTRTETINIYNVEGNSTSGSKLKNTYRRASDTQSQDHCFRENNGIAGQFAQPIFVARPVAFSERPVEANRTWHQDDHQDDSDYTSHDTRHEELNSSSSRVVLQQTQHQLVDADFVPGDVPTLIVLEKNRSTHQNSSKTRSPSLDGSNHTFHFSKTSQAKGKTTPRSKGVRPAVTETYDVDLEHREMMLKALQSYSHYQGQGNVPRTGTPLWDDKLTHLAQAAAEEPSRSSKNVHRTGSYSHVSQTSEKSSPPFKLAQCRLRYYDDNEEGKRRRMGNEAKKKKTLFKCKSNECNTPKRPASARSAPGSVLYPREEMNGVLVDSVGHVYRASQPSRPRSAVPCKMTDFVRLGGRYRTENTPASPQAVLTSKAEHSKRPVSSNAGCRPTPSGLSNITSIRPNTACSLKVVNLRLEGTALPTYNMAGQPIPHSVAYDRRNKTTHAWGDSGCLSQSMPSSSFLHRQYGTRSLGGSSASSPRSLRGEATSYSERSSPAGKPSEPGKPSASYSYDGGFFVGAHSGKAEYFVIHPDWVSEVMTIKKLSVSSAGGGRKNKAAPPVSHSAYFRPRSLQGRRCLSAPPQKRRNPITWVDSNFLADASNFDACGDNKAGSTVVAINGEATK